MSSHSVSDVDVSRRRFLRLTTAGALAGSAGLSLLIEACSNLPAAPKPSTDATPAAAGSASGSGLPTYMPSSGGPKADLHSSDSRITDGFINYPKQPGKSWTAGAPGSGGTLSVLMAGYYPAPTPRDTNATWKAVEQALNSSVVMTITPNADYAARFQVVIAGSDLPDVMHITGGTVANLMSNQFVQSQCADLTPYLGGDAARDYPNLAAIPTYAYQGAGGVFDNHLYGIPIHRYLPAFWFFRNTDIWDSEIGADVVPRDAEDFKKILQQLNRPQESRWAFGNFGPVNERMFGLVGFLEMFGAPNQWALDASGKLTRDRETEAYRSAVGYMKDLMTAGLYPSDFQTAGDSRGNFLAGRFVVSTEAFGNGWNDMWRRGLQQNPQRHYTIVKPFSASASVKPQHFLTGGTVAYNVLKKGSPDRVKEILRIMDYLAAPFGTEEDMLLTYGSRDQDYSVDADGNPSPTREGVANSQYVPWQYIAHRPYAWYQADLPGYAQAAFDVEQQLVSVGVPDPTRGFHSATQSRKGITADQTFHDGVADILLNRRPFAEFDQLVADWRSNAGDQIRKEFEAEIAASK
jgi:putative aldouronate transport system substrate-binding protein